MFSFTSSFSIYLQSPEIDFINALTMINSTCKQFKDIGSNLGSEDL